MSLCVPTVALEDMKSGCPRVHPMSPCPQGTLAAHGDTESWCPLVCPVSPCLSRPRGHGTGRCPHVPPVSPSPPRDNGGPWGHGAVAPPVHPMSPCPHRTWRREMSPCLSIPCPPPPMSPCPPRDIGGPWGHEVGVSPCLSHVPTSVPPPRVPMSTRDSVALGDMKVGCPHAHPVSPCPSGT